MFAGLYVEDKPELEVYRCFADIAEIYQQSTYKSFLLDEHPRDYIHIFAKKEIFSQIWTANRTETSNGMPYRGIKVISKDTTYTYRDAMEFEAFF